MRLNLLIAVFSFFSLQAEVVEWTGWHGCLNAKHLFDDPPSPKDAFGPMHKRMQYRLANIGWDIIHSASNDFGKGDIIIFHNTGRHITREWLLGTPGKKILVRWEPPTVFSHLYEKDYLDCFDKVITWNHKDVDNEKFYQMHYPVLIPIKSDLPSFSERKLICMINGNKESSWITIGGIEYDHHPKELYTIRRRIIEFYERNPDFSFDLYGWNWEKENYRNFIEGPPDKLAVMKQYRFSYAYENYRNDESYVTEKIFDCFATGTVPIYLGASNVTDYIPANCFIDARNFSSYENLYRYIASMREDQWLEYQENIRNFLNSPEARLFDVEPLVRTMLKACMELSS